MSPCIFSTIESQFLPFDTMILHCSAYSLELGPLVGYKLVTVHQDFHAGKQNAFSGFAITR